MRTRIMQKNSLTGLLLLLLISQVLLAKTPALHPLFRLLDENGQNVLTTGKALSTRQTCGTCHDTEYISSHSRHADVGLTTMNTFDHSETGYSWDRGNGYFGKWNPITYRYLSAPDDSLIDLSQSGWIQSQGFRHVGGGPAEFDLAGNRLDQSQTSDTWDWKKSGVVEMNCFLCHVSNPDNAARIEALENGHFQWANTATLSKTGIVHKTGNNYRWNASAFTKTGEVKRDYLTPSDPSNANCGQCHGLVFTAGDTRKGITGCDWNTATTGEIIGPHQISRTGLNLQNKKQLSRSWDIHAERAVKCVDCHPSSNNPIYYRDSEEHRLEHLIFDARRIDVVDFLYRPSHEFSKAGGGGEQGYFNAGMRTCDACHDPYTVHDWLPYPESHFRKVSCESCHIPRMHGPAYEQIDWTVLTPEKSAAHDCRGTDGDPRNIETLINGFEPILLPRVAADDQLKLTPYNLISSWYWVYGEPARPVRLEDLEKAYFENDEYRTNIMQVFDKSHNGIISEKELRLDNPEKEQQVRANLEALGLTQVRIQGDVQSFKISHDVTNGEWAIRECTDCHGNESRIGSSFELASYLPGGVLPVFTGDLPLGELGDLQVNDEGHLSYQMDVTGDAFYIFGLTRVRWIDWLGILIFIGTLLGIVVHSSLRVYAARQRVHQAPKTKRVYMYTFYERLWHWVQVMTIFLLLFTGFVIHKPEMFGWFSFPYMVQVHNVLGFILFANAFLAVFYHLVSGEIKQYIPQPRGFFDQAVAQAGYYLKGIFRGDDHPFEKTPEKKLNPLQQITYFGLLNFLLPLQIITGLLIWSAQTWPDIAASLGGLPILGPVHSILAWLFATFIVLHMYLTTTGHKPLDGVRAMINGWDEVEVHAKPEQANRNIEKKERR